MNLQQRNMITSEEIYNDLCLKIEKLEYMPGDAISENEICEAYGTSRHMVRAAFAYLKQRGLLEVYPQRGSFISLIDMDYISDILFMREAIEQEAVKRILESDNVESLCVKMRENLELQKEHIRDNIPGDEFYRLDNEFHQLILDAVGKKEILEMLSDPYIHVRRWRTFELRNTFRVAKLVKEHEEILDALEKKDPDEARRKIHYHLDTVGRFASSYEDMDNKYFYKRNNR